MYQRIIVGTDGSDTAATAVRRAAELASSVGATLEVLSAYSPVPTAKVKAEQKDAPEDAKWMVNPREEVDRLLHDAVAPLADLELDVQTVAREGEAADVILNHAEENKADLIVMGNKGMTGTKRFLLGGVPNKVSHHTPCDLLIVHTT